jgi:uncharacterized membrane protein HdeD (DUF308 family)
MTPRQTPDSAGDGAPTDLDPLVRNWWLVAVRGILAVLFGLVIVIWRVPVFDTVLVGFGTYAIVDGLVAVVFALRASGAHAAGWPIALEGLVSVTLGVLTFVWPFFPRHVLGVLVTWGLLTGIFEIASAARLPRRLAAHRLVGIGGVSSIFLALVVLALPHVGSERVALGLAAYAIVFGIAFLLAALRFRKPLPSEGRPR